MNHRIIAPLFTFALISSAASHVRAGDERFAVIVMVTDNEIVFDHGTKSGVKTGDKVELYRTITVHHPISGKKITDKFPIGQVRVDQASELLAIIKNSKKLLHPPKVGDLVMLPGEITTSFKKVEPAADKAKPAATVASVPAETDPETIALQATFEKSIGKSIDQRLAAYRVFLTTYPKGRYAPLVSEESAWLTRIGMSLAQTPETSDSAKSGDQAATKTKIVHQELDGLEVSDEAQVVIAVVPPELAVKANLFLRFKGDKGYDELPMTRDGAYYYRAHIPSKYVEKKGAFSYFVELVTAGGEALAAVGSAASPVTVRVAEPIVDRIRRKNRSVTRATFEYVNFDMDSSVDDEYWNFEADFFYRIFRFLYGVRVGAGFFNGTGGRLKAIEASSDNNQNLGAIYGYIEGEFEVVPLFHFMVRALAGNQRDPESSESESSGVFGLEGGIRIGEELNTNLVLAGALFQDIGYEARIALEINRFPKIPIMIEGLVTSFPVQDSDLGLRLVVGTGYRITDWLAVLARGSWNARTIKHTGFGGGASVALSW